MSDWLSVKLQCGCIVHLALINADACDALHVRTTEPQWFYTMAVVGPPPFGKVHPHRPSPAGHKPPLCVPPGILMRASKYPPV